MADYIPAGDEVFLDWAKNLSNYALARFADWGGNPQPRDVAGGAAG
ncbi:MAG: hypothetical protein LBQ55_06730 [Treponema sp.]|jgi:hypothetical protein|nr:hypothetical protein [Treponema sp.]